MSNCYVTNQKLHHHHLCRFQVLKININKEKKVYNKTKKIIKYSFFVTFVFKKK